MKTIAVGLLVLMFAGSALADPPVTQPVCTGEFTAIGANSVSFKFLSLSRGGHVLTESTDETTVVILSDGTSGKVSDLKVGQTARITLDESRKVAIKIEVGKSSWEATTQPATQPSSTITTGMPLARAIVILKAAGGREAEMDMAPPESKYGGFMTLKGFALPDGRVVGVVADKGADAKGLVLVEITVCNEPYLPKAERTWRKVDALDMGKPAADDPAVPRSNFRR